jgi:hypothetical protein
VGKFSCKVSGLIQWALHTVEMWGDELGLSVNRNKSGLVAFKRRRKLPWFFEPHFFSMILCHCMLVKYLGVVLDLWLTWREHLDVKVRMAHSFLWACRRACGVTWGLRPRVDDWPHVSIVRPPITFAYLVWWPDCQRVSTEKKLSTLQRPMLRDNESNAHHSHQCCGSTWLPPATRVSDTE